MKKLVSVSSYLRQPAGYSEFIKTTEQLRAEVANFDHVPLILIAELETALTGFRGEAIDVPAGASTAREAF
ncbi:hypothetical protein ACFFTN_01170 [Aminobacter aganoensis]|uniref:Uncharacterized protein n=1 Tax=Aminobacter aganoensis TaxID=83264 RepID=A0A7X0KJY3_9HYPH|nr:hypothetical protein [Aminobacter aganoensis]MBB6353533.1 hypothetical protein [Aminobacter aganoensis]